MCLFVAAFSPSASTREDGRKGGRGAGQRNLDTKCTEALTHAHTHTHAEEERMGGAGAQGKGERGEGFQGGREAGRRGSHRYRVSKQSSK